MSFAAGPRTAMTLVVGCLCACSNTPVPDLTFRVARPELDLGRAAWTVPVVPVDTLSILNLGEQPLLVTPLAFEGEGSELLTWGVADYAEILPGSSISVPVRPEVDRADWRSGVFAVEFVVEIGSAWNDPTDFDVAPVWLEDTVRAPVVFELDCDLDGDGEPSAACDGNDCDDGGPDPDHGPRCDPDETGDTGSP